MLNATLGANGFRTKSYNAVYATVQGKRNLSEMTKNTGNSGMNKLTHWFWINQLEKQTITR